MPKSLSARGELATNSVLRSDMEVFSQAIQNRYHATENPNGTFPLNVAENVLCWDMLEAKIRTVLGKNPTPDWVAGYTSSIGHPEVRQTFASFLSNFLTHCPMEADHLALSVGAAAAIEMTSFLIADDGDVAVFPAPCYPVYKSDIGNKSGVLRYDLQTHFDLAALKDGPILNIDHLEKAKIDIESQGKSFKMLVLTSPDNPTGGMYPKYLLIEIADWCINHQIHLIVNEIYGLSLVNISNVEIKNEYPIGQSFESFGNLIYHRKSDYLHLWYALSKDFGASGFRVGMLYSHNKNLIKAYENYNVPHMISNHTQWLFQMVLKDHDFVQSYIRKNQTAITDSYLEVIQSLKKLGLSYVPSRGSLFVWADFSKYMTHQSKESEQKLWMALYENTGVLFTPGDGFGHRKFGLFRIVYTCVPKSELQIALRRLEDYLVSL